MFEVSKALEYAESLVQMDEVERALLVLDNLPAKHRDNPPPEVLALRNAILSAMITPHAYLSSGLDAKVSPQTAVDNLRYNVRGRLIEAEVKAYNDKRLIPHIVDVGPGEYWVPLGLAQLGYRFSYWDVGLDQNAQQAARPHLDMYRRPTRLEGQPQIFLALEIIEHLPEPKDLAIECLRYCEGLPDRVHLSTPLYCYDERPKDWLKPCGLPHLRAYTPDEFMATARKLWPGYEWQGYSDRIISLRGMRGEKAPMLDLSFK